MIKLGDFRKVLKDEQADIIVTSPPYNIGSKSPAKTGRRAVGGYDAKSYRGIREYADNMREDKYQESQVKFLYWCYDHLLPGGVLMYNHKPRRKNGRMIHPMEWIAKCEAMVLTDEIVWDRGSTHNHCQQMFYQTSERIYVMRKTDDKVRRINHKQLGNCSGDVWYIPRSSVNGHNAPFPELLVENCIKAYAFDGCCIMDPYSGSGTTAIVAKRLGYDFVGAEKLEGYWKNSQERLNVLG